MGTCEQMQDGKMKEGGNDEQVEEVDKECMDKEGRCNG